MRIEYGIDEIIRLLEEARQECSKNETSIPMEELLTTIKGCLLYRLIRMGQISIEEFNLWAENVYLMGMEGR